MRDIAPLLGVIHAVIVLAAVMLAWMIIRARARRDDGQLSAFFPAWVLMGLILFGFWLLMLWLDRFKQYHYLVVGAELILYLFIGNITWEGRMSWRHYAPRKRW